MADWNAILAAATEATRPEYDQAVGTLSSNFNTQAGTLQQNLGTQRSALKSNYDTSVGNLTNDYTSQSGTLQKSLEDTLKSAYANYMKNKLGLPGVLAARGMVGGLAETTRNSMDAQYQNAGINARNAYSNAYQNLTKTYNANKTGLEGQYNTDLSNADMGYNTQYGNLQSQYNSDVVNARNMWSQNAYARAQAVYQQQLDEEAETRAAAQQAATRRSIPGQPTQPNQASSSPVTYGTGADKWYAAVNNTLASGTAIDPNAWARVINPNRGATYSRDASLRNAYQARRDLYGF